MRSRHLGGAFLAAVCMAMAAVPAVSAAARVNRVTIAAQPNPVVAGDAVVIYGQLFGSTVVNQTVTLYHRVAGQPGFTKVQTTKSNSIGGYEFARLPGVVSTNRAWYVVVDGRRSNTVRERVEAVVTFGGPPAGSVLLTGKAHPYTFTGTVTPATAGAQVVLQRQNSVSGGDDWGTIQTGHVGPGGHYTIVHVFTSPGDANLRVLVRANTRNIASPSSPVSYQIQQAQNSALTINGSPLPLPAGQVETITGTLAAGAGQQVSLFAATDNTHYQLVATTTTGTGGSYTFTQTPLNSIYYRVTGAGKTSARLFVGVQDVLSPLQASATTVAPGQAVTFTGSVSPNKTGHVIYLQRQNASGGDFHTIAVGTVSPGSVYTFVWSFFDPGTKVLRVLIPGGPENQGAATAPVTITVT